MAINIQDLPEIPTAVAVASYTLDRLGKHPSLILVMAEVVDSDEVNVFGTEALRPAKSGRQWTIRVDSKDPNQAGLLQHTLGGIMVSFGSQLLSALGINDVSQGQLLQAVLGMENIDSIITTELEKIELKRRNGELEFTLPTTGQAPPIQNISQ